MPQETYLIKARQFIAARQVSAINEHTAPQPAIDAHQNTMSTHDDHNHRTTVQPTPVHTPVSTEGDVPHDQRRIIRVKQLLATGEWKEAEREAACIRGRKDCLYWMNEVETAAGRGMGGERYESEKRC